MDDGPGRVRRDVLAQPGPQLVDPGDVAAARGVQLLAPTSHLSAEEPLGPTELRQAHGRDVDEVQVTQRVHQTLADLAGPLLSQRLQLGRRPVRHPVDQRHHVERRPEHRLVGAPRIRLGDRHRGPLERRDDAVLATHVVRRREDVAEGWAADDDRRRAVGHPVGEVGLAAGDELPDEGAVEERRCGSVQPLPQGGEVQARRVGGHASHTTLPTVTPSASRCTPSGSPSNRTRSPTTGAIAPSATSRSSCSWAARTRAGSTCA